MKLVITLCVIFTLASAAVIPDESQAKIVKYEYTNDGTGDYQYSFETSNGISRNEIGYVINPGKEDAYSFVIGFYSYTDPDGKLVSVKYMADENGFHVIKPELETQAVYSGIPPNVVASLLGK